MTVATPPELLGELRQHQLLSAVTLDALERDLSQFTSAIRLAEQLVLRGWLTTYQCRQLLAGHGDHLVLGPYRIQDKLGEGGMGMVVKAWSLRHNCPVALKILRPQGIGPKAADLLKRFERESQAIARLRHPNVVTRYESDEIEGIHFIAMEYVAGEDLEKMVRQRGALGLAQAVDYIRQAALGLQHASESGLVHRDIKPSNLLVTRSASTAVPMLRAVTPVPTTSHPWGLVKILDMGLARVGQAHDQPALTAITQQGTLLGTPDYMAPEQARDPSSVDCRADLYALGGTFYFLLTGRPPFPDGSLLEKISRHQTAYPQSVEAIRQDTPPALGDVIRRLMAKRPDERFPTPLTLIEALDSLSLPPRQARSGIGPTPTSAGTAPGACRRTPSVFAAAPTRFQPPPPADLVLPVKTLGQVAAHQGFVTALAFAAGGALLASGGLDDRARLWSTGGHRLQELADLRHELGEVTAVAFAPTQPYLVTGSSGVAGHVWRWDWREKGTNARTLVPDEPAHIDALTISPTGKLMAGSSAHLIRIWSATGRQPRRRMDLKGTDGRVKCLAFSPDGQWLAAGGDGREVVLWEFGWRRASPRRLHGHAGGVVALAFHPAGGLLATGGVDGSIRLWGPTPGAEAAVLTGHTHQVRDLTFTSSGRFLVSASSSGQVFLWDIAARARLRQWQLDVRGMAAALALAPGGRFIAVGGSDGSVSVCELQSGAA